LFVDDYELQLVDHRTARLSNFEPRAIKSFGTQQLGGRAVSFGSLPYGAPTAHETETRVLGYVPEEKLEAYFFALGKLAPLLVAVVPATTRHLTAQPQFDAEAPVQAHLTIHNYFSTFILANPDAGLIAARQLPFGAMAIAQDYADAFGIDGASASEFLFRRPHLPPVDAVRGDPVAVLEHRTASFAAIAPSLRALSEDVGATIDYFRYERMAGGPMALKLSFSGTQVAGLDAWLSEALDLPVERELVECGLAPDVSDAAPSLNLLEGSRAGLLKLGNQPFEFTGGKFKTIKGAEPKMQSNALNRPIQLPSLQNLSLPPGVMEWGSAFLAKHGLAAGAAAAAIFAIFANVLFLTSPAASALDRRVADYADAVQTNMAAANVANRNEEVVADSSSPLWADHLLSVSQALASDMRLKSIAVTPAAPSDTAAPMKITGILPTKKPDNLAAIGQFMERLSQDAAFKRRFSAVEFSGADTTAVPASNDMTFHIVATPAGAP
jgi:hypothetical protein